MVELGSIVNLIGNTVIITLLPSFSRPARVAIFFLMFNVAQVIYAFTDPLYTVHLIQNGRMSACGWARMDAKQFQAHGGPDQQLCADNRRPVNDEFGRVLAHHPITEVSPHLMPYLMSVNAASVWLGKCVSKNPSPIGF